MLAGLCRDYPTKMWYEYDGKKDRIAKQICSQCPSRPECLQYALENDETGVWGGTNDNDRTRMVTKFYVQDALQASSRHKKQRELERLASESPASLLRISFPRTHTRPVLSKAVVLQAPTFPMLYRA